MVNENERDVNRSLEEQFKNEDSRLQAALHSLQTVAEATSDKSRVSEALQKARAELVAVVQRYSIREVESTKNESENESEVYDDESDKKERSTTKPLKTLELSTEKGVDARWLTLDRPRELSVCGVAAGRVWVCFTFLNPEEERVVAENGLEGKVTYKAFIRRKKGE